MCKPYLTGPTPIICPGNNETLVFTCRDSQVFYLSWSVQPNYERFTEKDRITFTPGSEVMREDNRGPFTGKLVGIFNVSNTTTGRVADMVSTLTISSRGLLNGTNISCITWQETDDSELDMSITLILAGIYSCLFLTIHRCLQCTFFEAIFNRNFSYIEKPSPTTTMLEAGSAMLKSNYHNLIASLFKGLL